MLRVVCSAYEMGESKVLAGVSPDTWNDYNATTKVFYSTKINYNILKTLFKESNPDIVYINGMFLPKYNWLPLYIAKRQGIKVVLAPRGMLQQGALAVKPFKKKIFLSLFRFTGLHKNITWHATDEQEKIDIEKLFGNNANVKIALNIPKAPLPSWSQRNKQMEELRIVYLSLITEKKNLHLVLEALREMKTPIAFDIYGPVKDANYWESCQQLMKDQIHQISYKGAVNPFDVQSTLQKYHAFVLPTRGENFGHAIYEALSSGTVPIISPFTPWGYLQEHQAGIAVNSWKVEDWAKAIITLMSTDQEEFNKLSQNAFSLAGAYFKKNDFNSAVP